MDASPYVAMSNAGNRWPMKLTMSLPLQSSDRQKDQRLLDMLSKKSDAFLDFNEGVSDTDISLQHRAMDSYVIEVSSDAADPEQLMALTISFQANSEKDMNTYRAFMNKSVTEVLEQLQVTQEPSASGVQTEAIIVSPFNNIPNQDR